MHLPPQARVTLANKLTVGLIRCAGREGDHVKSALIFISELKFARKNYYIMKNKLFFLLIPEDIFFIFVVQLLCVKIPGKLFALVSCWTVNI